MAMGLNPRRAGKNQTERRKQPLSFLSLLTRGHTFAGLKEMPVAPVRWSLFGEPGLRRAVRTSVGLMVGRLSQRDGQESQVAPL